MRSIKAIVIIINFSCLLFISCDKKWLDAKPQQGVVNFNSLNDLQGLLDNTLVFNVEHPSRGEASADDYYITDGTFGTYGLDAQNTYVWASTLNFYGIPSITDWNTPYTSVFYANVVLEQIEKFIPNSSNSQHWRNIKGGAYFYRAYSFYNLAQLFCKAYEESTADSDLGLILRTESDINIKSARSTVKQTYNRIIQDLLEAKNLLSVDPIQFKTQPSKKAALAMLARVYLSMQKYDDAFLYADSCLKLGDELLDLNNLSSTDRFPFKRYNAEVLFHAYLRFNDLLPHRAGNGFIDSTLFNSYGTGDLRKARFFEPRLGRYYFRGSYSEDQFFFSGLSTNEVMLIKAECAARKGNTQDAMAILNSLLVTRWDNTIVFDPLTAANQEEALSKILLERRKELIFRGLRWTDLRRLNMDPRFAKSVTRKIGSSTFTIPANDRRYVLPIPDNEIIHSGVPQNPR